MILFDLINYGFKKCLSFCVEMFQLYSYQSINKVTQNLTVCLLLQGVLVFNFKQHNLYAVHDE